MTHEAPQSHEHEPQDKTISFNDGETALQWDTPGSVLEVGMGATHKYLRDMGHDHLTIIKTRSGNSYGLGENIVINAKTRQAFIAPAEIPDITIGEPLQIPGVGGTTEVESVTVRYKSGDVAGVTDHIDSPSPFPALGQAIRQAQDVLEQSRVN